MDLTLDRAIGSKTAGKIRLHAFSLSNFAGEDFAGRETSR
jgi:hypothetical protein